MDIAALSTDLSQQRLSDQVGTAVLAKTLDFARQENAGLQSLINSAQPETVRDPSLGSRVDLLA